MAEHKRKFREKQFIKSGTDRQTSKSDYNDLINWAEMPQQTCSSHQVMHIFFLYFSMNHREFMVKSKLIISSSQTKNLHISLSTSLFQKIGFL